LNIINNVGELVLVWCLVMSSGQVSVSERVWKLGLIIYLFGLLVFLVDSEEALGNSESAGVVMISGLIGLLIMALGTIVPVKRVGYSLITLYTG
jgi:hypothetical protein